MPSLHLSLKDRPVILRVLYLEAWDGEQNKPLSKFRWKQRPTTPPGLSQVHGARWDSKGAEGAGRGDFQVTFHHLSVVLVNQERSQKIGG